MENDLPSCSTLVTNKTELSLSNSNSSEPTSLLNDELNNTKKYVYSIKQNDIDQDLVVNQELIVNSIKQNDDNDINQQLIVNSIKQIDADDDENDIDQELVSIFENAIDVDSNTNNHRKDIVCELKNTNKNEKSLLEDNVIIKEEFIVDEEFGLINNITTKDEIEDIKSKNNLDSENIKTNQYLTESSCNSKEILDNLQNDGSSSSSSLELNVEEVVLPSVKEEVVLPVVEEQVVIDEIINEDLILADSNDTINEDLLLADPEEKDLLLADPEDNDLLPVVEQDDNKCILIQSNSDDNNEGESSPDINLPLINCPTVLLDNINKENIEFNKNHSSSVLPSIINENIVASDSESDEPLPPGGGNLYQDEDFFSWRQNNSSGENSEIEEVGGDEENDGTGGGGVQGGVGVGNVSNRKRKLNNDNHLGGIYQDGAGDDDNGQPSCKKIFQPDDKTESTSLPDTSSNVNSSPNTIKPIPSKDNPPAEMVQWLQQFQAWSNAERTVSIGLLIDQCEPPQIRHMMQLIEPQFQRDFISLLPRELALYVLSYLKPEDLLIAAQICRSWRFLAEDNLLWKEKCVEEGIDTELPPAVNASKRSRHKYSYSTSSPWKALFMSHKSIELNWRIKNIREPKVLKGHDDHVITCLQFSGSRIVSGSDDNTLKVWSATTGKCLRTLFGHSGGVWSSQMQGNIIISGSTDRTLKVWNADTGHCLHTLFGHTSTVRCMHLHGKKVVSGSRDATLRVWHIESGECLHVLMGHLAAVRCVQYDGKLIVSGAYDYMVKIWKPETEECLHTLNGHTNRVYSLQFDGVHIVSGSLDTSIRVWEAESGHLRHTLMGHQSLTSGMELRNNILVSGNADSTVKVWDIITGRCLQTLSGRHKHQSAVTCLQFNSKFVITSSDDGTVKLWDVKTGEFVRNLVSLDSGGSGGVVWRIRASETKLVCAVGSRNGTEETKLLVLDFDDETK